MTAVRSAMVRLSRRSCVFRHAAPWTPPLRHSAVGNLKNLQRFSTCKQCADPKESPLIKGKAVSVLNMLRRWSRDSMRNVREVEPTKALCVSFAITSVTSLYFTARIIWSLKQHADESYDKFF